MRSRYLTLISALFSLSVGLGLVAPVAAQPQENIQYVYDSLNRLVRVIDQNGEVATYNYDAVGNILSIERTTVDQLGPPELTSVTPDQVNQGESATLVLTGTSLLGGTVTTTHPGLTIEGSSGTDTQITAPVSVAVTAALGTATLTVTTVAGSDSIQIEVLGPQPLITGVTPSEGPSFGGTQVTVSGSHLTPDTSVAFGGNPATDVAFVDTSTLTATTPAGPATNPPTAVDVVVSNPNGSDTLADGFLYIFGIQFGQVVSADIAVLGEEDKYAFEGTAGDQVLLRMSRTSGTLDPQMRVFHADGTAVPNCSASTILVTLELTCVLDGSGPYTLLASDGSGDETGGYALTLQRLNNPANATPIAIGEILSGTIDPAVELDTYTFTGTAGDRVLLRMSRTSGTLDPQLRVFRADGTAVPNCSASTILVTLEITCALDGSGPYTLLASDGSGDETGGYDLSLLPP